MITCAASSSGLKLLSRAEKLSLENLAKVSRRILVQAQIAKSRQESESRKSGKQLAPHLHPGQNDKSRQETESAKSGK